MPNLNEEYNVDLRRVGFKVTDQNVDGCQTRVEAYLPWCWHLVQSGFTYRETEGRTPEVYFLALIVQIDGSDVHGYGSDGNGWTWDGYLKDRLASGLIFELDPNCDVVVG
jgi:hypothetical protein